MAGKWVEVPKNLPMAPKSIMRLHFTTVGITYVTATQIAMIEKRLDQKKEFFVRSHSIPKKDGFLSDFYFEVEVREPTPDSDPEIQKAGISAEFIAAMIIAAALIYLSFQFAEVMVLESGGSAAEKVGEAAAKSAEVVTSVSGAIVMAIIGYIFLKVIEK